MSVSKESPPPLSPQTRHSALSRLNTEQRTEFWASLALRYTRGLGPRSCKRLLEHFGSAYEAVRHPRDWSAAQVHEGKSALLSAGSWRTPAQLEWEGARAVCADILLWRDPDYPQRLRELPDAPLLLYCRGDRRLLRAPCVALVGSRACSPEGMAVARDIAGRLSAAGITIVSGLAIGIDSQAHLAALRHPGKTVAVLGTGIDVIYPKRNARLFAHIAAEGLILTEFMPSSPPDARHFPVRNRLISGLSLGVLIVEATRKSGSLITARFALEQNREVYAIPGPVFAELSEGCQDLVRQGARAVFSAEDILRDLAPQLLDYGVQNSAPDNLAPPEDPDMREAAAQPADEAMPPHGRIPTGPEVPEGEAGRIVRALRARGPCHIDALARHVDLPVARLSALLVQLEVQSLVLRLPGMLYTTRE